LINFAISKCKKTRKNIEITLEGNPSDLTKEGKLEELIQAGINRISLGIQVEKDPQI